MRLYENDGLHPRLTLAEFPYVTWVVKSRLLLSPGFSLLDRREIGEGGATKMPALVGGFRLAVLLTRIDSTVPSCMSVTALMHEQ